MSEQQNQDLARFVEETIRTLYERGIAATDLAPLVKLHEAVKAQDAVQSICAMPESHESAPGVPAKPGGHHDGDARGEKEEASDNLLARVTAIIDVLVQGGDSPEHATQVMARQLLAAGVPVPASGGDARAWKRLFNWRNNLIHYKRKGPAWEVYCAFREELANIPPEDRLRLAVGDRLWDKRKPQISDQNIA